MNIPIYRAKKIDSDKYVEGFLTYEVHEKHKKYFIEEAPTEINEVFTSYDRIDPSTLAIHFSNMIANDSDRLLLNGEKDLRIFASLSEDGKGGDILDAWQEHGGYNMGDLKFTATFPYRGHKDSTLQVRKVIGIQQ